VLRSRHAAFDKLRLKDNLRGAKKAPHAEPVEARTVPIQARMGEQAYAITLHF
jgi:hypothetical protein